MEISNDDAFQISRFMLIVVVVVILVSSGVFAVMGPNVTQYNYAVSAEKVSSNEVNESESIMLESLQPELQNAIQESYTKNNNDVDSTAVSVTVTEPFDIDNLTVVSDDSQYLLVSIEEWTYQNSYIFANTEFAKLYRIILGICVVSGVFFAGILFGTVANRL